MDEIIVRTVLQQTDDGWVAHAFEYGLNASGTTRDSAIHNIVGCVFVQIISDETHGVAPLSERKPDSEMAAEFYRFNNGTRDDLIGPDSFGLIGHPSLPRIRSRTAHR